MLCMCSGKVLNGDIYIYTVNICTHTHRQLLEMPSAKHINISFPVYFDKRISSNF